MRTRRLRPDPAEEPGGPSEVRAAGDAPVPAVGRVAEAAASADPGAGSRVTCPAPTTRRSGSSGVSPRDGSTSSRVDAATDAAETEGRVSRFRAETREERIAIAAEAQARYERTVSWGARVGDTTTLFTHLAVPVMTRLRQPERAVLDTLVDAGVARSRSDALAWSVKLVGEHADSWLGDLRDAMTEVDKLRAKGPEIS